MSDTYCHLCDADPCYCGQHGKVEPTPPKSINRTGPRGMDDAVREFVLTSHEAGVRRGWKGWKELILEEFHGPDHDDDDALRHAWNRVNNSLQREWLLIDDPAGEGPMMPPAHYPQVRRLSTAEGIAEVERLIETGGWKVGEKGLRLWEVWRRIPNVVYISIYDALHDMNGRGYLVTTRAPSGNHSQFWYVKS